MGAQVVTVLGVRLRAAREERNLGLRAAADEIGVSFNTLSRIERGADCRHSHAEAIWKWLRAAGLDDEDHSDDGLMDRRRDPPSAATHAFVRRVPPREVPSPPETWPIIEHEPEHIPDVPPDLSADDGNLHLWECAHVLRLPGGNPDFKRCGFIARGERDGEPGWCPYDHGERRVRLVPLTAVALCSDCANPVPADDCRTPDGRLVCGTCAMNYIPTDESDADMPAGGAGW